MTPWMTPLGCCETSPWCFWALDSPIHRCTDLQVLLEDRPWFSRGLGSLAALATLTATWMARYGEMDHLRNGGWILYHKLIGIYNITGISGYYDISFIMIYPLVMTSSLPWKDPPIFKNGKPSISMGHFPWLC